MIRKCRLFEKLTSLLEVNAILAILLATIGCVSVGPEFTAPEARVPDAWELPDIGNADIPLREWWSIFDDAPLADLIRDVRDQNLDMAAATARLHSYAAGYGVARSQLFPQIGAFGGMARDRETERVRNPIGASINNNPTWMYQSGLMMSWEIDVWGKIRRSMEVARGEWDASIEDKRNLMVILQAQAASEYILLRTTQQRLAFARMNVKLQEETLKLVTDRYEAGLTSELDVHQARMNLESTRSQIPLLLTQQVEALNTLCLLTGRLPGEMSYLANEQEIPLAQDVPQSLPADLLRNRPDIRAAERRLAAQTARIGVAKADFLPTLDLHGNFALVASEADDFLDAEAHKYNVGPSFNWSIFNAGAVRSRVRAEEAATAAARIHYEQTIIAAYRESENALASYSNEQETLAALRQAVESATQSVELSKSLYVNGLVNFQNVLDMQRQLAVHQDQMASSTGRSSIGLVAIYKALGGGWDPAD